MIRRLRIKFIAITMGVLLVVFAVVFFTLNIFMQTSSTHQTEYLLQTVADHDGFFFRPKANPPRPDKPSSPLFAPEPDMMRVGRFFYVKLSESNKAIDMDFEMMFDFTQEEALEFAMEALNTGRDSGNIENLQYLVAEKGYGKIVVFAERSIEAQILAQLIRISLWIAGITFVILFIFSLFLSNWAIKPVANTFEKQRRFISDASHELKTPLTIIGANIDLLENEIGTNKRISHIKDQSGRMNLLIRNLLILAKTDESNEAVIMREFNLSKAIKNTSLEFESAAFEAGKHLSFNVEDNITYVGNEPQIKQLLSILIDNAINHSNDSGIIKVTLHRNKEKIQLSVYNTGPGVKEDEKEKIFDRFYRSDDSRSRETGGYGLGLSIAKSIVSVHKSKITVAGKPESWVEFIVTF